MPSFRDDHDKTVTSILEDWRLTAESEVEDIRGWREAPGKRLSRHGWTDAPQWFWGQTSYLIAWFAKELPHLDSSPLLDIFEWVSAWHKDQDAHRIPLQDEVDLREQRAMAIVQAAGYIIDERCVASPKPVVLLTWGVREQLLIHGLVGAADNVPKWCADHNIPSFDETGVRDKFKTDPPKTDVNDPDPRYWPRHLVLGAIHKAAFPEPEAALPDTKEVASVSANARTPSGTAATRGTSLHLDVRTGEVRFGDAAARMKPRLQPFKLLVHFADKAGMVQSIAELITLDFMSESTDAHRQAVSRLKTKLQSAGLPGLAERIINADQGWMLELNTDQITVNRIDP